MAAQIVDSLFLGALEGLTEFIPVSSTGHLLLASHFLGFDSTGKTFEVLIQLGAILAIIGAYAARLAQLVRGLGRDPKEMRFLVSVVIAFLPAAAVGFLAHDYIKAVLFESPRLIATTLIIGGLVLLVVDRLPLTPRHHQSDALPFRVAPRPWTMRPLPIGWIAMPPINSARTAAPAGPNVPTRPDTSQTMPDAAIPGAPSN